MRPCDCKDQFSIDKLKEVGIKVNGISLTLWSNKVVIESPQYTIKIPSSVFKHFSEWYSEDQL